MPGRSVTAARRVAAVTAAAVLAGPVIAGCGLGGTSVVRSRHSVVTTTTRPRPVRVHRAVRRVGAGHSAELLAARRVHGRRVQVALLARVGRPAVSHAALGSYGYPPANGTYLSFPVRLRNTGQVTVLVKPTQFSVDVGGAETHVTSYDGSAPYSGARAQLDPVPLAPGESVAHPLTFDVDASHGTLTYAPGGKPAIRWVF
jgi:hypothetical protein